MSKKNKTASRAVKPAKPVILPQPAKKKFPINYCLLGFLIPFVGMLLVIAVRAYLMERETTTAVFSLLNSDAYHQYFPFFKSFREALRNGESLLFNWDYGLGTDHLGLIAYYLGSPLNLLSVFVPEAWLVDYFTLLNPIRVGLAGWFFALMLKKIFGKDDFSIAIFAAFYATCSWVLGYMWNVMWMDTFALLPLVVLGTVSLLRDRKFLLYTLSLFFSVAICYYIGFFTCIFTLLVFIVYQICCWRSVKRFFADLALMGLFTLIALGMTGFITLPAYAALQTTSSSVNEFPETFRLNIVDSHTWRGLLSAMKQVATNNFALTEANYSASEALPNLYCGVFTNVLLVLLLTTKRVKWRERICTVVLLLFLDASFVIRQLDYIWHGFHFTNMIPYRFSFIYSFTLLFAAYRAWTLRRRFRIWQVPVAIGVGAVMLLLSNAYTDGSQALTKWLANGASISQLVESEDLSPLYPIVNFLLLALYMAGLLIYCYRQPLKKRAKWKVKRQWYQKRRECRELGAMVLAVVVCLEFVIHLGFYGTYMKTVNLSAYPRGKEDTQRIIAIMKELEEDNLFYRTETSHTQTYNDGALNDYYGITTFSSSANASVTTFMNALGYAAQPNWNRYAFEESSPVGNMFLGLKYMIERQGKMKNNPYFTDIHSSGKVHLLENNYYLPLGFMVDASLAELSFADPGNRFTFQDQLLSAATGSTVNAWAQLTADDIYISATEGVSLSSLSDASPFFCSYQSGSSGGSVFYTLTFRQEGLLCVHFNMPKRNEITVSYDDAGSGYKTLYTESYAIPQMFSVCHVKPGDKVQLTLKCKANESGTLNIASAILDEFVFRDVHHQLSQSTLELTTFENTLVEGTIQCQQDGLLYTSIPHCGNWEAYVDGQPAQVTLIGDAMVGVMLTQGSHTVTFRYHNRAFQTGVVISLCCLIALGGLCGYVYWLPKRKKKPSGEV